MKFSAMQSSLPLILSYPLVNIFESGRRLQQQHLVTYLWTCHPSCKQLSPSSYLAILPIPDHNTLHDFIRIELDGQFWSNFEDVDSIPSEKPHETTFLINVPKTCSTPAPLVYTWSRTLSRSNGAVAVRLRAPATTPATK